MCIADLKIICQLLLINIILKHEQQAINQLLNFNYCSFILRLQWASNRGK